MNILRYSAVVKGDKSYQMKWLGHNTYLHQFVFQRDMDRLKNTQHTLSLIVFKLNKGISLFCLEEITC